MDKETKSALKRAEKEEENHVPSVEELRREDKDFKKTEKDAFRILKKK